MAIRVKLFTDPACPWSWACEPVTRQLIVSFAGEVQWTLIMGGLARTFEDPPAQLVHWLDVADTGEMPIDPRLWSESPIASSYPASMAVKAAAEQSGDAGLAYLRAVREGLFCFRRKLDTTEALVEEARRTALDVARFRLDLGSHAIVEAFGADLELARAVPEQARAQDAVEQSGGVERVPFPSAQFSGPGGEHWVFGPKPYEQWRQAALAAGAVELAPEPWSVERALRRFPILATAEVAALCDLPGPRAPAELWRLAADWKVKPTRVLTGHLWELA